MSSIRAYVNGEGLWSKAQKEAVTSLIKYTNSFDEEDYRDYQSFLSIPLGDKQARLELEKPKPNLHVVGQGFVQGGNHPKDVTDLVFLYRWFGDVSYIEQAIQTWTAADLEIDRLIIVGQEIQETVGVLRSERDSKKQSVSQIELDNLVAEVYVVDRRATILENRFSAILGEGSRQIRDLLIVVTIILTVLLGATALFIAWTIERILSQVDKAKSEFVSLTSHQLRTPITIINWYLEKIIKTQQGVSDDQKTYLEEVYAASKRMVSLINALLSASRIELGTLKGEIVQVDAKAIADQVIEELKPQREAKQITIQKEYQENLPPIFADVKLLTMIFQNLLSNAVKYSKDTTTVTCKIMQVKKNFLIEVTDTGCGIPIGQRSKIFTKMFRADNARTIDPEGTGLGLYIVKAIVDGTNGKIWFVSEENHGTTFFVSFPANGMQPKRRKN